MSIQSSLVYLGRAPMIAMCQEVTISENEPVLDKRGTWRYSPAKILPGFMMPFGSAILFISRMKGRESPCSFCR